MGLLEGFSPVSAPQLAQIRSNVFMTSGQKATATLYIVLGLILVFFLYCIASHWIALQSVTVERSTLHCIALHYRTAQYIALHYITLDCITVQYITVQYSAVHCIALQDFP